MAAVIIVKAGGRVIGRCDDKCHDAITRTCRCCCGGVNHGRGLDKALSNLSYMYDAVIISNCKEAGFQAKVIRPAHQHGLFDKQR